MARCKQGQAPVKHLAPKILMAVHYCGRQLARRIGWAAPAFHKKEGASTYPGVCKHSLQYDGRPDERFGTWNSGSLGGKGGEMKN